MRIWQREPVACAVIASLALVACNPDGAQPVSEGMAGATGWSTGGGSSGGSNTGGASAEPWMFGEPLNSDRGEFWVQNHDRRLIRGTWEALRVEEHSLDISWPYEIEFLPSEGVSVEVVEAEPFRFHAETLGPARVPFRGTDKHGTTEDSFSFEVEEPVSFTMGTCDRVLGGFGVGVRLLLNDRSSPTPPQGLLPVTVSPAHAAEVKAIDGYLASEFQLLISAGFVGTFELRSTLADRSINQLTAVAPSELQPPRILGNGTVGIGKTFTVGVEPSTADGVVCSRIPVTLTATAASDCRVVRLQPDAFYHPFGRPMFELVGEVVGGLCEVVVQYDQVELEAMLGAEWYAALPAASRAPVTVQLDIEILTNAPPGSTVDSGGGSGDGWD